MRDDIIRHYDALVDEGNDPVLDPPPLRAYMDKWDGEAFLALLAPKAGERILEIGCGSGRLAVRILPRVGEFWGIDLSPRSLARAREHLGGGAHLICGDFLTCEIGVRFDAIYASLVLFHIQNKMAAFRRMRELLRPGGRVVLSIDKSADTALICGDRTLPLYPDTPEGTTAGLRAAGFTEIHGEETEFAYLIRCWRE